MCTVRLNTSTNPDKSNIKRNQNIKISPVFKNWKIILCKLEYLMFVSLKTRNSCPHKLSWSHKRNIQFSEYKHVCQSLNGRKILLSFCVNELCHNISMCRYVGYNSHLLTMLCVHHIVTSMNQYETTTMIFCSTNIYSNSVGCDVESRYNISLLPFLFIMYDRYIQPIGRWRW